MPFADVDYKACIANIPGWTYYGRALEEMAEYAFSNCEPVHALSQFLNVFSYINCGILELMIACDVCTYYYKVNGSVNVTHEDKIRNSSVALITASFPTPINLRAICSIINVFSHLR